MVKAFAAALILLHAPDGHQILINPEAVTSLHSAVPNRLSKDKLYSSEIHCLVNLSDGKFVGVVESCDEIKRMLEPTR